MSERSVLLVDDEAAALNLMGLMLKRVGGITIYSAQDGESALQILDETTPDLVVLDYMLPDMNGVELCRQIRARPETTDVRILGLTAADKSIGDEFREAGANDYLAKHLFGHANFVAKLREIGFLP